MSKTNYIFLRTVKEEGRERMRALPGQKHEDGQAILDSLDVQANIEIRKSYPLGTIFGTDKLNTRTSLTNKPFYNAGEIYPVGIQPNEYCSASHMPPPEMQDAFSNYRQMQATRIAIKRTQI